MANVISHQGNVNQNHNRQHFMSTGMAVITKKETYQVLARMWELEPQGRKNFPLLC